MSDIKQVKFINQKINRKNEIYNITKIKRKLKKMKNTNKINLYRLIKKFIKTKNNKNINIIFSNIYISFKIITKNISEKYINIILSLNRSLKSQKSQVKKLTIL